MIKWDLIVLSGSQAGRHIFKNSVITAASLPFVKGDLKTLGLVLTKFSELAGRLEELLDATLELTKRTKGECVPVQAARVIDPSNYNFSYAITQPPPIVIQTTGVTLPSTGEYPTINPLEPVNGDCPTCRPTVEVEKLLRKKESPRAENKTGSFICSNCKKPHVGEEWHTDWSSDGTPITFLCESCYSRMSAQQRIEAYQAYASRQTLRNGQTALLHQEIGE